MITSASNAKVKLVRSLARRRARYAARQFVAEGVRSIEEAQGAGIVPALVFYTAPVQADARAQILLSRLAEMTSEVYETSPAVMQAMSGTETAPGILVVYPFLDLPLPLQPKLLLILDAVRDPGNAGTILRSAWAAGADGVLCAPGTADPYNAKVVRAGMGAHFRIPIVTAHEWKVIQEIVRDIPRVYVADTRGEVVYTRADWSRPLALIVGGEAEGAEPEANRLATARVNIPMRQGAESLNAAMAATLLLFEAARH